MWSTFQPQFIPLSYTDSNSVAHVERYCHLSTLGGVNRTLAQHRALVGYRYIIVGSKDGFDTLRLTQLFEYRENTLTDYLMVIQRICLSYNHIGQITT